MADSVLRNEQKFMISLQTAELLKTRLGAVMRRDSHAGINGAYHIRSLYFDDAVNGAYSDKVSGTDERMKFRIRCYDRDYDHLILEKKEKRGSLSRKTSQSLNRRQADALMRGDLSPCRFGAPPLLQEFGALALSLVLRPAVIVDYLRYPFVYTESNTRITLDCDVRSGGSN